MSVLGAARWLLPLAIAGVAVATPRVAKADAEGNATNAQTEVQNVDRKIGDALRAITSPARVQLDVIAASEFDQSADPRTPRGTPLVMYEAKHLFLVNVSVNALAVTGDLVSWDYTQDTWPGRRATQERCPALYR